MTLKALIFGELGALAEVDDLHRRAYNESFRASGLDWEWPAESYSPAFSRAVARHRLVAHAESLGQQIDATAILARKDDAFDRLLAGEGVALRDGVRETMDAARQAGVRLALVPGQDAEDTRKVFDALGGQAEMAEFDEITYPDDTRAAKPDPAPYQQTLKLMGLRAREVVAVENCPETAHSPLSAGIATYGYPAAPARAALFPLDVIRLPRLSPEILQHPSDAAA